MASKNTDRRGFLKGAAAGAALAAQAPLVAQQIRNAAPVAAKPAPETTDGGERVEVLTNERPGADFMVDVIKSLGIEYAAANPALELPRAARIASSTMAATASRNC